MNESTCSSKFQTDLRRALPGSEVIKHADKSMIGMVDASVTSNRKTLWIEYKFIGPQTKGVTGEFMRCGAWSPQLVADASPTQAAKARSLATAGHCIYLFWVLDPTAVRKRVAYVQMWNPINGESINLADTDEAIHRVCQFFRPQESVVPERLVKFFASL